MRSKLIPPLLGYYTMAGGAGGVPVLTLADAEHYWLASSYTASGLADASGNEVPLGLPGGTADPVYVEHTYDGYYLPGIEGNYIWTPPSTALKALAGDTEIIFAGRMTTWAGDLTLIGCRYSGSDTSKRAFRVYTKTNAFRITWYESTNTARGAASTSVIPFAAGEYGAVKVTLDVDNGSGGYTVTFYTSTNYNPATGAGDWSQLGNPTTAAGGLDGGVTDIRTFADDDVMFEVGSYNNGLSLGPAGVYHRAIVKSGIGGTTIADFDASQTADTINLDGTFESGGDTYTIARAGTGKRSAFVDRDCLIFDGVDDYIIASSEVFADEHWVVACQQSGDIAVKVINAVPGAVSGSDFRVGYVADRTDFANMQLIGAAVFATQPTGADLAALSVEFMGKDVSAPYFERYASNPIIQTAVNMSLARALNFSVIKASLHIAEPINTYYGYLSTDHSVGAGGIYLFTAADPKGPWTEYEPSGSPGAIYTDAVVGQQTETPVVIWDSANSRYLMYYHNLACPSTGLQSSLAAYSTDGISWTRIGIILEANETDPHKGYLARPMVDGSTMYSTSYLEGWALTRRTGMWSSANGLAWTFIAEVDQYTAAVDDVFHTAYSAFVKYGGKYYTLTGDRDTNELLRSRPVAIRQASNHYDFESHPHTAFPTNAAWEDTVTCEIWGTYCEGTVAYVYYAIDRAAIGVAVGVCDA